MSKAIKSFTLLCLSQLVLLNSGNVFANTNNETKIQIDKNKIARDIERLKQDKAILQSDRDQLKAITKTLEKDRETMIKDMRQLDIDKANLERDAFISKKDKADDNDILSTDPIGKASEDPSTGDFGDFTD